MKRILNLEIESCSQCPYNVYSEYDDVGVSFGMDYFCIQGGGKVITLSGGQESIVGLTKLECQTTIRENCPLPKKEPLDK